jgi:hypothetical protein
MANKSQPYHSEDSDVYHIYSDCTVGNNIETDKRRNGEGGNRLCKNCEAIKLGLRKR